MTGSRLLNGTTPLHEELEERIAGFLGVESAIVFSTGYLANLGAISALVDRGCWAIIDKGVHASIYDGVAMAAGQSRRFRHDDMAHLEEVLRRIPDQAPRIVITDGVHSMTGGGGAAAGVDGGLPAARDTPAGGRCSRDRHAGGDGTRHSQPLRAGAA